MSIEEIGETLRRGDPDRFGASLIAAPDAREKLWVLYTLNNEVARAPLQTQEPLVAEMRLQWWVDQLEGVAKGYLPSHDLLAQIAMTWGAEAAELIPLAEARRRDCERLPFADADEVVAYVRATSVPLMQLAIRSLDSTAPAGVQPVMEAQALGAGIATWLAALPELTAYGLGLRQQDSGTLSELARRGRTALDTARSGRRDVPRRFAPALYRGPRLRPFLAGVEASGDIAQPKPSEFQRRLALGRLALTGRWWT